jgi:hypothetical protein
MVIFSIFIPYLAFSKGFAIGKLFCRSITSSLKTIFKISGRSTIGKLVLVSHWQTDPLHLAGGLGSDEIG